MPWGALGLAATVPGTGDAYRTGVDDLCWGLGPEGPVLYASSGPGGGLSAYRMEGGGLVPLDRLALPTAGTAGVEGRVALIDGEGTPLAAVTGVKGIGLWAAKLDAEGGFATGKAVAVGGAVLPPDLHAAISADVDGTEYVYGLRLGSDAVSVWRVGAGGSLSAVSTPAPARPAASGPGLADLAHVERGGADDYLLGASATGDALVCWRIGADGVPVETGRIGAAEGVPIDAPAAVAAVPMGGRAFAILASAGSGTLTVAEVLADGRLAVTDHVLDDARTRFGAAREVEAVVAGGRVFVVTAGADDGVTLFELLPGGRLLQLSTLVDGTDRPLANVSALAVTVSGGVLHVVVASASEPGLASLQAPLPSGGLRWEGGAAAEAHAGSGGDDLLMGWGGDDSLGGGNGDDLLMDGAGADTLRGGAGADRFVLAADGSPDTIADFDPARDRIDLSGWKLLRSTAQLAVTPTANGAEIRFGAEVLRIATFDGRPLSVAQVQALDLLNLSRLLPSWTSPVVPPQTLSGGAGADRLVGGSQDDLLGGNGGNDSLDGGWGRDRLYGGDGDDQASGDGDGDTLWGGAGADRLWGDDGHDSLWGEAGADTFYGGTGNDALWGGSEADALWGEAGADRLDGDGGDDRLHGGDGDDSLWGDGGNDLLQGGPGRDALWGDAGHDSLHGEAGNDSLSGLDGNDALWGEAGDDRLSGGLGTDTLWGAEGLDRLEGGEGGDALHGGAGNDSLLGGMGNDRLMGDPGDDSLNGQAGHDWLQGLDGLDRIRGEDGNDSLYGGLGGDLLWGDAGHDLLWGEGGADSAWGGLGNDSLWGGDGHDWLTGDAGADLLDGGAGNDTLLGWDGDDRLAGGLGDDRLLGGGSRDSLRGGAGQDRIEAGLGDDSLWGEDGHDQLWGQDNNDRLDGGGGNDTLYGGTGDDSLLGGLGHDWLTGGAGADRFVFAAGSDRVRDFQDGIDTILIDDALWGGGARTAAQILDLAAVEGGNVVFRFAGGHVLVVEGVADPGRLLDDLGWC